MCSFHDTFHFSWIFLFSSVSSLGTCCHIVTSLLPKSHPGYFLSVYLRSSSPSMLFFFFLSSFLLQDFYDLTSLVSDTMTDLFTISFFLKDSGVHPCDRLYNGPRTPNPIFHETLGLCLFVYWGGIGFLCSSILPENWTLTSHVTVLF